jgi:RHS repeat-associated protein
VDPRLNPKQFGRGNVVLAAAFLTAILWFLLRQAVGAEEAPPKLRPNRTVPAHSNPSAAFVLAENPSAQEIHAVRLFSEPLLTASAAPSAEENRALAKSLHYHVKRSVVDDYADLEQFVAEHPKSPWTGSVLFNLGTEYYRTGWYSKCLDAWQKAWPLLKDAKDPAAKALADRAGGELAYMYARLGRMGELSSLLSSLTNRVMTGSVAEKISGAKQGLWTMQHQPEIAFRCGPLALSRILARQDPTKLDSRALFTSKSTTNGFSLSQVAALSRELGMNYQMAYREPGATLKVPAVINWKVGHYAALVREENELILAEDPTFGNETWLTRRALEAEASGYFLVPPGELTAGWRSVSEEEGKTVWGKGQTINNDPDSTTPEDKKAHKKECDKGMASVNAHLMTVSLNIVDTPVGYNPPVGPPVHFTLTYNQREAGQPANFWYSNVGQNWTFNWQASIVDNPSNLVADVEYHTEGGGILPFSGFDSASQAFAPQVKSQAQLRRTSSTSYEMLFPDGSKRIFAQPDTEAGTSRRVFMTQVLDPQDNAVTITYDNLFRIIALTDAIGQVTTFFYDFPYDPNDPLSAYLKITRVIDPFGRSATLEYTSTLDPGITQTGVRGLALRSITDCIGLVSQFNLLTNSLNGGLQSRFYSMTTPYGTTSFLPVDTGRDRSLEITYPNGEKELIIYSENPAVGVLNSDPPAVVPQGMGTFNAYLFPRNTYFWDRRAYSAYRTNDYTKAHIYHWLHSPDMTSAMGILESEKLPLENRVWYNYEGQNPYFAGAPPFPGNSSRPSAIGRVLDDGTTQLWRYQYNALGRITQMVDPLGRSRSFLYSTNLVDLLEVRQTTGTNNDLLARFVYNDQHHPVASWDAAGQMTTNIYSGNGQLLTTTNPKGETHTFYYDTNGYLLAIVGPLQDTNSFTYDFAGRPRTGTSSDGHMLVYAYDALDRLTNITYPDGTFRAFEYDRLDRVTALDRMGRKTRYIYDQLQHLTSVEDPLHRLVHFNYCGCGSISDFVDGRGRRTTWGYDVQGRLTTKQYADGSRILYTYESTTGRLKSVCNERSQLKVYDYYNDNALHRVTYPDTTTAGVTFTYDPDYPRITAMEDEAGSTTYSYYPNTLESGSGAGRLAMVSCPFTNGTVVFDYDKMGRVTTKLIGGVGWNLEYDSLGRVASVTNVLGKFVYTYLGSSPRRSSVLYPNGQVALYTYYDNLGDNLLQQLQNLDSDSNLLSSFSYMYDLEGTVTNWTQQAGTQTPLTWQCGHDPANQLVQVLISSNGNAVQQFTYSYDAAGNRMQEQIGSSQSFAEYNALNELVSSSAMSNSVSQLYEWDAENRVVAILAGDQRVDFTYDGAGRRIRILETTNGAVVRDARFLWCGNDLCEQRDGQTGTVSKRYLPMGMSVLQGANPGSYFYSLDHLGSVHEMTDAESSVRARYSYDPYGLATKTEGDLESDFGFTGHFEHRPTSVILTPFRVYAPRIGRWLSRDPLGERAGPNVYSYVRNSPVRLLDPLGLDILDSPNPDRPNATITCDGDGGFRVQLTLEQQRPRGAGDQAIADCIQQHEESHKTDFEDNWPDLCEYHSEDWLSQPDESRETDESEVRAYQVSMDCFLKALLQFPSCSAEAVRLGMEYEHAMQKQQDFLAGQSLLRPPLRRTCNCEGRFYE